MIKLSIVIATYNRAADLVRTLESLTEQTYPAEQWECVAVDNNSKDDTRARFEEFRAAHPALNLRMVGESNQGLSWARNRGIAESRGEIIAIIDDDETVNPDFVRGYIELFESHPEVSAAGGRVVPYYINGRPRWMSRYTERPIAGTLDLGAAIKPFVKGYPAGGNMAMRRSDIEVLGVFSTSLGRTGSNPLGGEEKEIMQRFADAGRQIYYTPVPVIYHYIPDSKLTDEYFSRLCRMCGVSERVMSESRGRLGRAKFAELLKWGATIVIAFGYLLSGNLPKASKLVELRLNVTRGLFDVPQSN
ncbi:MAG: glycosyltransferase family 2 protein [Rikenellaceae bacterium]|nr:glycosyltransferase family 2 protein [Rikenellaceae bacterium]